MMCMNCAKNGKKLGFSRGFCHFLNFGDSDGLDIAYDGSPKQQTNKQTNKQQTTNKQKKTLKLNTATKNFLNTDLAALFSLI